MQNIFGLRAPSYRSEDGLAGLGVRRESFDFLFISLLTLMRATSPSHVYLMFNISGSDALTSMERIDIHLTLFLCPS
ncbi:hypothetical protein RRG08_049505 [Elysia crispata]|uniref:Uncharacterized protein n=1 Tax=Elysia crispata TaxID=231223 RepID=A0AAE0ZEI3_9GAST|nr:hypothetical protein RRG08_049505 [Elysia crispata]